MSTGPMPMPMPCAACKLLRRRCTTQCIFLPYFPPSESHNFEAVHRVFGASNLTKLLQKIPVDRREDAAKSMVYEAKARVMDPVYGSVGLIASLQSQVLHLHGELIAATAEATSLRVQLSQTMSLQGQATMDIQQSLHSSCDHDFSIYDIGLQEEI